MAKQTPNAGKPRYAGRPAQYLHTLAVGDSENHLHPAQTTQLDVLAPGSFDDLPAADFGLPGGPSSFEGTSFATALVSGAAALVWARTGTDNPQVVAYLLRRTARFGKRWSQKHGFGTIDVEKALSTRVPADDEFEPNDTFRSAWSSPTTPSACPRRCILHGIVGKTDDPQDWWPIRARSCASISSRVTAGAARVVGCRAVRRGRVSVGVAAGERRTAAVTRKNALVAYTLRITAR